MPEPNKRQFVVMFVMWSALTAYAFVRGDETAAWASLVASNVWLCGYAIVECLAPGKAAAGGEDREDNEIVAMLGGH